MHAAWRVWRAAVSVVLLQYTVCWGRGWLTLHFLFIVCCILVDAMPDTARIAALDKPVYQGPQLPRFFDAEQLCAQGLKKKDLVAKPVWFSTVSEYRKILDLARKNTTDDESMVLSLGTTEAGDKFRDRANITVRQPGQWPAHSLISELLMGSGRFERQDVRACKTMEQQLNLLKKMPGWTDVNLTGAVNEAFGERLSNALELVYFGVPAKKVRDWRSFMH